MDYLKRKDDGRFVVRVGRQFAQREKDGREAIEQHLAPLRSIVINIDLSTDRDDKPG